MKGFLLALVAILAALGVVSSAVVCPPTPGDPTIPNNIRNPANCSTFFSCNNGIPVEEPCPLELEWDDKTKQCDLPSIANCKTDKSASQEEQIVPESAAAAKIECPPGNAGEAPNNVANPANCSTFYSCSNGVPVLQICAIGLEWNDAAKVCDYPELAKCKVTAEKEASSSLKQQAEVLATTCPAVDPEDPTHPIHLPHPTDCTLFYKCWNGVPYLHQCGPGLHWNADKDYCDYPDQANCEKLISV